MHTAGQKYNVGKIRRACKRKRGIRDARRGLSCKRGKYGSPDHFSTLGNYPQYGLRACKREKARIKRCVADPCCSLPSRKDFPQMSANDWKEQRPKTAKAKAACKKKRAGGQRLQGVLLTLRKKWRAHAEKLCKSANLQPDVCLNFLAEGLRPKGRKKGKRR